MSGMQAPRSFFVRLIVFIVVIEVGVVPGCADAGSCETHQDGDTPPLAQQAAGDQKKQGDAQHEQCRCGIVQPFHQAQPPGGNICFGKLRVAAYAADPCGGNAADRSIVARGAVFYAVRW